MSEQSISPGGVRFREYPGLCCLHGLRGHIRRLVECVMDWEGELHRAYPTVALPLPEGVAGWHLRGLSQLILSTRHHGLHSS